MWFSGEFVMDRFELEQGAVLSPCRISFDMTAPATGGAEEVIVLLPSASGLKTWCDPHVGAEATFDPRHYLVISVDALGGGQSSRPSEGLGPHFPECTIRDHARAVHRLLSEHLGLHTISAVGGPSMGAMIALELALAQPKLVNRLLLYSPSERCSAMFKALIAALSQIARLPQGGLHAAALAYFPLLVSHEFLERVSPAHWQAVSSKLADKWSAEWNVDDLLNRYAAVASHDIGPGEARAHEALRQLQTRTLLMPSTSDLLLSMESAHRMAELLPNATYIPIQSDLGHWAASQAPESGEFSQVQAATRRFLER